jgi:thiol-disulfide isomerase/thioredoxin
MVGKLMKKHLTVKILLISMTLIFFAFIAMHVFDADPVADSTSDSRKLERLFEDMGVDKLPQDTDPVEIRLQDINGNLVSLSDFRGRIVFLNFWTTWCPTCLIEMPSMEKLHQKFKDKDFAMVTVNIQESSDQVEKFFKKFKLTFTALLDTTGEVAIGFSIRSIPTTFILDKSGRTIGTILGPREWDSKIAVALFEHLIDKYEATSAPISAQ